MCGDIPRKKKKSKWECYWLQTPTVERLSAPHQTVLEVFLGYRKLLYSCTERMCHSSTLPVIALGQCSAINHSIILHSKLPAQGNAWWWKTVQLTPACDMMQRRALTVLHVYTSNSSTQYLKLFCNNPPRSNTLIHTWGNKKDCRLRPGFEQTLHFHVLR